jgi:hypothetical protein
MFAGQNVEFRAALLTTRMTIAPGFPAQTHLFQFVTLRA